MTGFGALAPLGAIGFNSAYLLTSSGAQATDAAYQTQLGIAQGLYGQGPWATTQTPVSYVTSTAPNMVPDGGLSRRAASWSNVTAPWGVGIGGYGEGNYFAASVSGSAYTGGPVSPWFALGGSATVCLQAEMAMAGWQQGTANVDIEMKRADGSSVYSNRCQIGANQSFVPISTVIVTDPNTVQARARVFVEGCVAASVQVRRIKLAGGTGATIFTDEATTGALYGSGASIDTLMPAELGANVTGVHIAQGFQGQSPIATMMSLAYGSAYLTGFGALAPLGSISFNSPYILTSSGVQATDSAYQTQLGIAQGVQNQGPAATATAAQAMNSYVSNKGANRVQLSQAEKGGTGYICGYNPNGWSFNVFGTNVSGLQGVKLESYSPSQSGQVISLGTDHAMDFAVTPGEFIGISLGLEGQGISNQSAVLWHVDQNGNNFSPVTIYNGAAVTYGTRVGIPVMQVQAGAVKGRIELYGTYQGSGGYLSLVLVRPMVAGVSPNQQDIPPFSPGPVGAVSDTRFLTAGVTAGLRSLASFPVYSSSVVAGSNGGSSTATVNLSADGVAYNDVGQQFPFPAASIPGLALSTQYYFYRQMATPVLDGGTSWAYSTNLTDALGPNKAYNGYYTTPNASGGGGSGGVAGGGSCVGVDAWVLTANRGAVRAPDVEIGDLLVVLTEDLDGVTTAPCSHNEPGENLVCEVSIAGARLPLAVNTPMTQPDGSYAMAANVWAHRVATIDHADQPKPVWRLGADVFGVGERAVRRIGCSNGTYAASATPDGPWIFSHNAVPIKQPN